MPDELARWEARGARAAVFGRDVFHVADGPVGAEPLLILHGFPTCSLDFRHALPKLAARHRVVLHDHLGFGLSAKPRDGSYSYSLLEQAEVAIGLWRSLGIERGHLLAHDYGTSVATELLARRERGLLPVRLLSVTLCNGSVHLELARLRLAQRLLRRPLLGPLLVLLTGRRFFHANMRRILGDARSVAPAELDLQFDALARDGGRSLLPAISRYLDERVRFRARWIGALERLDIPTHVLWADRDPIAVPAIARALAAEIPSARLTWLPGLGHYPMLEAPDRWADAALAFLDSQPR